MGYYGFCNDYEGAEQFVMNHLKHGSFNIMIRKILSDDDYPIGTHGSTTLLCLAADCIKKSLEDSDVEIERNVKNGLCAFTKEIPNLSKRELFRLCNFIQLAEIPLRLYGSAYREFLNNWKTPRRILHRALLLRLLGEGGEHFTLEALEEEKEIKEKYPWLWIDTAFSPGCKYFDVAINEIKQLIKKDKKHGHNISPRLYSALDYDDYGFIIIEKFERAIQEVRSFFIDKKNDLNELKEECLSIRERLKEAEQARFWLINRLAHLLSERR